MQSQETIEKLMHRHKTPHFHDAWDVQSHNGHQCFNPQIKCLLLFRRFTLVNV